MITTLHRGGTAKWLQYYIGGGMPKWLHYYIGGGSLGTPKSDYVICAWPLLELSSSLSSRQVVYHLCRSILDKNELEILIWVIISKFDLLSHRSNTLICWNFVVTTILTSPSSPIVTMSTCFTASQSTSCLSSICNRTAWNIDTFDFALVKNKSWWKGGGRYYCYALSSFV